MGQVVKVIEPADRIPNQRIFLMGGGKCVQPRTASRFCKEVVEAVFDGEFLDYELFALGCAATLDAVSRGSLDIDGDPVINVKRMWNEVNNTTTKLNVVTDIMRFKVEDEAE